MEEIVATDADNDTLTYTMIEQTGPASRHFHVDRYTGVVYVKAPIPADSDDFEFRVRVSDDGNPAKRFTASVRGQ